MITSFVFRYKCLNYLTLKRQALKVLITIKYGAISEL